MGATGGTGVTRTPRADRAGGVLAGAVDDGTGAAPAERAARCTGGVAVDAGCGAGAGVDAPLRARGVRGCAPEAEVRVGATEPAGTPGAPVSEVSVGIARRGATGIRWTGGGPGGGARGVEDGWRAGVPKAPDSRLSPAAGFSTAGDGALVNNGFCHVGR
ncbi:hypothetical protein ACFU2J_32695, partial [Streptomyces sp. NPDC057387]